MYKVLLVDDEMIIRESICQNIKWKDLGFELIEACRDGREAMESIHRNPPDLLLTDICMPYVDGIELARCIYEDFPDTKVILISGYDEFDYAKKAVKYKVVDYILKPVTAMELSDVLKKVREDFDKRERNRRNIRNLRRTYVSNLPTIRGKILGRLVHGELPEINMLEEMERYQIIMDAHTYTVALFLPEITNTAFGKSKEMNGELLKFSIQNIAEEILSRYGFGEVFETMEGELVCIWEECDTEEHVSLTEVCQKIKDAIFTYLEVKVTIFTGKRVTDWRNLPESYYCAKVVSDYRFLFEQGSIVDASNFNSKSNKELPEQSDHKKDTLNFAGIKQNIILSMKKNDKELTEHYILQFIREARDKLVKKERLITMIQNLILATGNLLAEARVERQDLKEKEQDLLNSIYNFPDITSLGIVVIRWCDEVMDAIFYENESSCNKLVIQALEYIEQNYQRSDLSLSQVCAHLSLSTSYFSHVFKDYTGETFLEVLTGKRIEKAKCLIENTSLKLYEIADEVGISDPHYFSLIFKKLTGTPPTEYARQKRGYHEKKNR